MKKSTNHLKIVFNAPVTLTFVFICIIVQALNTLTAGAIQPVFTCYFADNPLSPVTWFHYVSFCVGHTSWQHLLGNMSYILLLGPLIEEKYGSIDTILIMLISAVSTGIIGHFLFLSSGVIGASGIVFTFIILASITGTKSGIPLTMLIIAVLYLGTELRDDIFVQDNISHFGHLIGGCVGIALGLFLRKDKNGET